jgi:hypothetical protein
MTSYFWKEYKVRDDTNWKVGTCPKGYAFAIQREDNSVICTLHNGLTPSDKALAVLITAAPDMLNALDNIWSDEYMRSKLTYEQSIAVHDALAKAHNWYKTEVNHA